MNAITPNMEGRLAVGNYHVHPTPAMIRAYITRALAEDYQQNPMNGEAAFIPVRVDRLINEAITRACEAHARGLA